MKNPTNAGFAQDYNAQVAVDQQSLLIVGCALSNHPNDSRGALSPRWLPFHRRSARRRLQRWTLATLAPRH
jgi:hypothetical protein